MYIIASNGNLRSTLHSNMWQLKRQKQQYIVISSIIENTRHINRHVENFSNRDMRNIRNLSIWKTHREQKKIVVSLLIRKDTYRQCVYKNGTLNLLFRTSKWCLCLETENQFIAAEFHLKRTGLSLICHKYFSYVYSSIYQLK